MQAKTIVPIVSTAKMAETRAFYVEKLGLQLSFEHPHYLGVRTGDEGAAEIGFMLPDTDWPDEFGGKGISFGIGVENADTECDRLRQAGVTILSDPADMPWGARAFSITDPNGVVLLISHPIPADVEFAACVK